jgi:tetratricopeptide (TPR) repeat protein
MMKKHLTIAALLAAGAVAQAALAADLKACAHLKRAYPGTSVQQAQSNLRDAQNGSDPLLKAEAMYALAEIRYFGADVKGGDELVSQANAIWTGLPPTVPLALRLQDEAKKLMQAGDCRSAATTLKTAVSIAERAVPADESITYSILGDLVSYQAASANLATLKQTAPRLIAYWQKAGEPADSVSAPVYRRMVELYYQEEQYEPAAQMAQRNLRNGEQVYGTEHAALIPRLDDLAIAYYALLRYQDGEAAAERAAAIYQKTNPNGKARFVLGGQQKLESEMRRRYNQGDVAGALALGEQDIRRQQQQLDMDAQALHVAVTALEQEQVLARRAPLQTAERRARTRLMYAERPLAALRMNVAEILHAQQHYDQAQAMYQQAIDGYARSSADPLEAAGAKSALATLYRTRGNADEALRLQSEALEQLLPAFGPDHPDVIDSARELSMIYQRQHKTAEAAALAERVPALRGR